MIQVKVRCCDVDRYLKLLDKVGIGAGYSTWQYVKVDVHSQNKKDVLIAKKLAKNI